MSLNSNGIWRLWYYNWHELCEELCGQNKFQFQKTNIVGNFIKPGQSTVHDGAQPEEATREKSEKNRRSHHNCKRYWSSSARWIPWGAIRIVWGPLHRGPWCRVCILEIRQSKIFRIIALNPSRRCNHLISSLEFANDKRAKRFVCYCAIRTFFWNPSYYSGGDKIYKHNLAILFLNPNIRQCC